MPIAHLLCAGPPNMPCNRSINSLAFCANAGSFTCGCTTSQARRKPASLSSKRYLGNTSRNTCRAASAALASHDGWRNAARSAMPDSRSFKMAMARPFVSFGAPPATGKADGADVVVGVAAKGVVASNRRCLRWPSEPGNAAAAPRTDDGGAGDGAGAATARSGVGAVVGAAPVRDAVRAAAKAAKASEDTGIGTVRGAASTATAAGGCDGAPVMGGLLTAFTRAASTVVYKFWTSRSELRRTSRVSLRSLTPESVASKPKLGRTSIWTHRTSRMRATLDGLASAVAHSAKVLTNFGSV
mmetsp:Transcript_30289/g.87320  ORF Transcript_30289/g.87320 Transcript_30289/m.87320 type:complete len:299 (+) Transcript_30289:874-1770(+)